MRAIIAASVLLGVGASPSFAKPLVAVGQFESEKTCTLYKLTAGRHREVGAVDAYGGIYASETSWRDYLVRDCIDHFASLRTSIEAALASSGKLDVSPTRSGTYVVSGRISEVSGGGPAAPAPNMPNGGWAMSASNMVVNMDVTVRDPSGRIIYGGLMTKKIETGFNMDTGGLSSTSTHTGKAVYTELQHQVALAVARLVAFKIAPLRVTNVAGERIQLNYGAPLLGLGTIVQVTGSDGSLARYNVTGAGAISAQADYEGDGKPLSVAAGNMAMVIEADSAEAKARRFERVDLP